jgi:hypothetical protein
LKSREIALNNETEKSKLDGSDIRRVLAAFARPHLDTKAKKQAASAATQLSIGAIDGMIYDERGGISAWQNLLSYIFGVTGKRLEIVLEEIKESLRKQSKPSKGQLLWSAVGDELTDDEKIFFAELALAHKRLKPPFEVKQKKK